MATPTWFLALEIAWLFVMLSAIYYMFTLRNTRTEGTVATVPWIALFVNVSAVIINSANPSVSNWEWQPYLFNFQIAACALQAICCVRFWHKKRQTRCETCGRSGVTNDPCLDCGSVVLVTEKDSLVAISEKSPSDLEKA